MIYVTQAERDMCAAAIKSDPEGVSKALLDEIERLRAWAAVETPAAKELQMVLKGALGYLIDTGYWASLEPGLIERVKRACEDA